MIKVNELESLKSVSELKLKNTENKSLQINEDSLIEEQSNNVISDIEGGM